MLIVRERTLQRAPTRSTPLSQRWHTADTGTPRKPNCPNTHCITHVCTLCQASRHASKTPARDGAKQKAKQEATAGRAAPDPTVSRRVDVTSLYGFRCEKAYSIAPHRTTEKQEFCPWQKTRLYISRRYFCPSCATPPPPLSQSLPLSFPATPCKRSWSCSLQYTIG